MQTSIGFGINGYENVELNFLNTNNASELLGKLPEQINVNTFSNFCLVCQANVLDQELVNNLLDRLVPEEKINLDIFSNFCYACQPNLLNKNQVNNLLSRLSNSNSVLNMNDTIFANTFSKVCLTFQNKVLDEKHAIDLLILLRQGEKINAITFLNFCYACQDEAINKSVTSDIINRKNFSFSEIDQNKLPLILNKFKLSARPLVAQKMQDDLTRKNKKGLGVGIFLTLAGIGILISPFTFGASSLFTILLIAGGGAVAGIFGGISIFNGVKISIKKRMANNAQKQVEIETSEGNNSTQTYDEEEEINQEDQPSGSITETIANANYRSSIGTEEEENKIIPKNQNEEKDKSRPEIGEP